MPAIPPAIRNLIVRLKQQSEKLQSFKLPAFKKSGAKKSGSGRSGSGRSEPEFDRSELDETGYVRSDFGFNIERDDYSQESADSEPADSTEPGLFDRLKDLPRPPRWVLIGGAGTAVVVLAGLWIWASAPRPRENNNEIVLAVPPEAQETNAPAWEAMVDEGGADANLIERGPSGPLPIISADGRNSWQVYARPFDLGDHSPRIAVVIGGLGLRATETQAAIDTLPPAVTLSFNAYTPGLISWVARARHAGHEVLIGVPMGSVSYPQDDPGPQTLLTSLTPRQNLDRLEFVMGRAVAYVGVTNVSGSRFTASREEFKPILEAIKGRGLLYLEHRASSHSIGPAVANDLSLMHAIEDQAIDDEPTRAAIDRNLGELEKTARHNGIAVGMGDASYPITLTRLAAWIGTLEKKGLALAPITAVIRETVDRKDSVR